MALALTASRASSADYFHIINYFFGRQCYVTLEITTAPRILILMMTFATMIFLMISLELLLASPRYFTIASVSLIDYCPVLPPVLAHAPPMPVNAASALSPMMRL